MPAPTYSQQFSVGLLGTRGWCETGGLGVVWWHTPTNRGTMTDQNTHTAINIGDVITPEQMSTLPEGSEVTDVDGDTYVRLTGDESGWAINGNGYPDWNHREVADYCGPATLTSLPGRAQMVVPAEALVADQPDTYQQARLALRDRYGVEPNIDDVHAVERVMEDQNLEASAAVTAIGVSRVTGTPAPQLVAGFGIAVSGGGNAAAETVDTDDSVKGLARLRAHAALDRILDQMGISR